MNEKRYPKFRHATAPSLALAAISALAPAPARAEEFVVTRTDDPPLGGCSASDCSLRGAIVGANQDAGADTIGLSPGVYGLTIPRSSLSQFPDSFKGDLDVTHNVVIRTRNGDAVIDANGATIDDRGLELHSGALTLEHVSVIDGNAPPDGDDVGRGGGIRADGGTLTMRDGRIAQSAARDNGSKGAGLYNAGGAILLERVIVEANDASSLGGVNDVGGFAGGIFNEPGGSVTLRSSVVRTNNAAFGGGLAGEGFLLDSSSLRRNTSGDGGGGYLYGSGITELRNTTVNHNGAGLGPGGGLRVANGTVFLASSTVAANSATDGGGVSIRDDAGGDPAAIHINHSVVAGNTAGTHPDCAQNADGLLVTGGHNLIGNSEGCAVTPADGDLIGGPAAPVDPMLGPDSFNGGLLDAVFTLPLRKSSPAVDGGSEDLGDCQGVDGRGVPRKAPCDIGAYERRQCGGVLVDRVGTAEADGGSNAELAPEADADGFLGLGGEDHLRGDKGDDGLCGGGGSDRLEGGRGADVLVGGRGHDVCDGGPGRDKATGCELERSIP